MAILLFHLLFHAVKSFVKIELINAQSEIKYLVITLETNKCNPFYKEAIMPMSYEYFADVKSLKRYPFSKDEYGSEVDSLPKFHLTYSNPTEKIDGNSLNADVCVIELNNYSLLTLAELWLNISRKDNRCIEISLESPIWGYGGVSKYSSCEAIFWLSESIGFANE